MKSLAQFFEEPLGRITWLAIAAVMMLVGLRGIGGPVGYGVAILAGLPLLLMLAGTHPLVDILRRWMRGAH